MKKLKVLTWLWNQTPNIHGYNEEKVNVWAAMMKRHLTIPHTLACVTEPERAGKIDPDVEIIPLPEDFADIKLSKWKESKGWPQCYRRLVMFAPDAKERFGADRIISMDLDIIVSSNVDHLFTHDKPFKIYKGTNSDRPYNGSLIDITVGARTNLYTEFSLEGAKRSRDKFLGSDQAWIAYGLGWLEATWDTEDGVYFFQPLFARRYFRPDQTVPDKLCILCFPGFIKPWHLLASDWIREHWRIDAPFPMPEEVHNCLKHLKCSVMPTNARTRQDDASVVDLESASNYNRIRSGKSGRYAPTAKQYVEASVARSASGAIGGIGATGTSSTAPSSANKHADVRSIEARGREDVGLYAFDGRAGWGKAFKKAANLLGYKCILFKDPSIVPEGAKAFVRLDQYREQRERTKSIIEVLAAKGVTTLPNLKESRWYDNKILQADVLKPWLPETWVFTETIAAIEAVQALPYPLVSKASEGASSANVCKIDTIEDSLEEIRFIDEFEKVLSYGRKQKGYVYFQRMIEDLTCDYRVSVAGGCFFGLIRRVREDDFRASGSGLLQDFDLSTEKERRAVKLALKVSRKIQTSFMCYDIVFDPKTDKAFVLECSSSWSNQNEGTVYSIERFEACSSFETPSDRADLIAGRRCKENLLLLQEAVKILC